jgi:hypothetical protein
MRRTITHPPPTIGLNALLVRFERIVAPWRGEIAGRN